MCHHPTHEENLSRKGVLCAPDSSNFFLHPVDYAVFVEG